MNKSRTVYECCRGLHYIDPSLPENPREISCNRVFETSNLIVLWKIYMRLARGETETDKLSDSPRIFAVDFVRAERLPASGPSSWPCAFFLLKAMFWTKLNSFLQFYCLNQVYSIYRLRLCWNQPGVTLSNTKNWGVDQGKNLRWLCAYSWIC